MNRHTSFGDADADGPYRQLEAFDDADQAVARLSEIYRRSATTITERFERFAAGERDLGDYDATYPYLGLEAGHEDFLGDYLIDARPAFGTLPRPGRYGTTLTRPDLFADYYREQIGLLQRNHGTPVWVGESRQTIPLPFVIEDATEDVTSDDVRALQANFVLPDLATIDDAIANGTHQTAPGMPAPMSLFSAERVDLGLLRLQHYTGTNQKYFQRFVLFTNYQRYVDEFVEYGRACVAASVSQDNDYTALVEPGDVITGHLSFAAAVGTPPVHLPQMPAYHLVREDGDGITLVNIGVGPSNAKTLTDHLAVLRPHCWMMIGHCGGLRASQKLGDYVLAHAYVRSDHVLNQDLPSWVPVPPIAEVQVALQEAVAEVTGGRGPDLKSRMRTGTVASTDNRNWELRHDDYFRQFSQSRAIAIDMESATIAANGFRFRVPYGTLLCVSDKPMHGEIKLRGMANAFYRERINQHLKIGLEAVRRLRENIDQIHSRKLRSLDEPPFR
ncbi:MAG: AMP nucleosidase [Alphaproteobacteria bacterium]|nr:AMP nucleosidase [Alphaproteobacteria bacterium]MCZ6763374.1 AMP nucleosidase [Alphaproteobacteria bacterium]